MVNFSISKNVQKCMFCACKYYVLKLMYKHEKRLSKLAKNICFINKCPFKSSPRSAYYVTVTPYGSDEILFCPPRQLTKDY